MEKNQSIEIKNTLRLLRLPFSLFFLPLFLLVWSEVDIHNVNAFVFSFFILHFLVYPSSNGYNSYVDKDESAIGLIEHPPQPTQLLFYLTLILDITALILSLFFVNTLFFSGVAIYILFSRLYSSPFFRLKKYPVLSLIIVSFVQGGLIFLTILCVFIPDYRDIEPRFLVLSLACSLQIAASYPMTQIYQHDSDLKAGIRSFSYLLGVQGTFIFSSIIFICSFGCYFSYYFGLNQLWKFTALSLFSLPILIYFFYWFWQVRKDINQANFKNTMYLNWISAVTLTGCFAFLIGMK